jgi:RNA recognition motif-containing protein
MQNPLDNVALVALKAMLEQPGQSNYVPLKGRFPPPSAPHVSPIISTSMSINERLQSLAQNLTSSLETGGGTVSGSGNAPKDHFQLFIGNAINDGRNIDIKAFLNQSMRQVGLNTTDADPIILVRQAQKYSFAEFRSVEDCNAALNLNGIPFNGALLKIDRPRTYNGPKIASRTWQEITGQSAPSGTLVFESGVGGASDPATKPFREIFVGNTPEGTTMASIGEFIGAALQKLGLAQPEGSNSLSSPITQVRVNTKFCFLEMCTVEEAANVLNLNGIPFAGQTLNIKRTAKHDASLGPDPSNNFMWDGLLASWMSGDLKVLTSGTPSNVIVCTNMVSSTTLSSADAMDDMIDDTTEECTKHGKVKSVYVDREQVKQMVQLNRAGRLFIETESQEDAKNILLALKGRSYENRIVDVKFYPTQAWSQKIYDAPLDIVIVSATGQIQRTSIFEPR